MCLKFLPRLIRPTWVASLQLYRVNKLALASSGGYKLCTFGARKWYVWVVTCKWCVWVVSDALNSSYACLTCKLLTIWSLIVLRRLHYMNRKQSYIIGFISEAYNTLQKHTSSSALSSSEFWIVLPPVASSTSYYHSRQQHYVIFVCRSACPQNETRFSPQRNKVLKTAF